jgi:SAM-dependent methyltransferase
VAKWHARIAANSIKACVPFQAEIRKLKHTIRPPVPGQHHDLVLDGILQQIALIRQTGRPIEGARVLEIGSGWIPVAPLVYRLAGAREVILSDQHRLLHPRSVEAAASFLMARQERLVRELGIDKACIGEVLDVPLSGGLDGMLAALGLAYVVPLHDATLNGTIDLAYSHTVLEHIPPAALAEIFALVRRRLTPGGLFCNGIDNSDHRRCYDDDVPLVDFLRYSEIGWKLLCINPQDYTNRLRHSDYLALLEAAGFEVMEAQVHVAQCALRTIDPPRLPERFRDKTPEDLCTTWSLMLARG